jgi:hypothetical protein
MPTVACLLVIGSSRRYTALIEAEYHLMLSSVYASSPAMLSPSSLIAAKHVHDGGPSTGWIVAIVIGLALVALLVYTSSSGHLGSDESEPDEQTLPPNELVERLEFSEPSITAIYAFGSRRVRASQTGVPYMRHCK